MRALGWGLRAAADLELQPWLSDSPEGCGLPVGLLRLLPHDHVEAAAVLIAEEEACVVIISHRVHVKGFLQVEVLEPGAPYIPTAKPGSLFMV